MRTMGDALGQPYPLPIWLYVIPALGLVFWTTNTILDTILAFKACEASNTPPPGDVQLSSVVVAGS